MARATHLILLMCQYFFRAAAEHGLLVSNTKSLKIPNPGFGIFPLFPKKTSQPSHDPDFEPFEEGFGLWKPKIIPPSSKILAQFPDNLPQAFARLRLVNSRTLALNRFMLLTSPMRSRSVARPSAIFFGHRGDLPG